MIREQKTFVIKQENMQKARNDLENQGLRFVDENSFRVVYTDGIDYYILIYKW